ncbi:Os09g0506525 [Oryza sativa Japonica Group]|uniref:Os09g0506525 protein n=1 Tax=Oryza sativa subsp. japonica TaxID=39947 RepID=A0A0P0XNU6_ORYSJ|nr:Os09g0506525 [Oryza sativa Japonica Group]
MIFSVLNATVPDNNTTLVIIRGDPILQNFNHLVLPATTPSQGSEHQLLAKSFSHLPSTAQPRYHHQVGDHVWLSGAIPFATIQHTTSLAESKQSLEAYNPTSIVHAESGEMPSAAVASSTASSAPGWEA